MWNDLLGRLRSMDWFWSLPPWLRDPPGLYIVLGLMALGVLVALYRWVEPLRYRFARDPEKADLRRELRDLRKQGDTRGLGKRYEALGKPRKALAAYRQGGHREEEVHLLVAQGKVDKAKTAAREGQVWGAYAELCEADGEWAEAAAAFERIGQDYAAGRCYEQGGDLEMAATCYQRAGLDAKAIELLSDGQGRRAVETLEAAVRASWQRQGSDQERDRAAIRRAAQLWLEESDPQRAFQLAVDCEQWDVALPIARDFLPPSPQTAETCLRAGDELAAAEIYRKLGDTRQEALARAEHAQRHDDAIEAGRWFEVAEEWHSAAEQWASAGESLRSAQLFAKAGDYRQAADLFASAGDTVQQHQMLSRLAAVSQVIDGPAGPAAGPSASQGPITHTIPDPAVGADRPTAPLADTARAGGQLYPTRPSPALATGAVRYELVAELGRGGMGIVYRAMDRMLDREVAFKRLIDEAQAMDPEAVEDLMAEAKAAARLSHANIVQIYDAGQDAQGYFIVMELIDGENFAQLLKKHQFTVQAVVRVGRQICAALHHAHGRRIIHRDLKPSNLMWTSDHLVKLTDFGLARMIEESMSKVLTRAAGTPFYMAPEQIRGEAIDPRTDLYSLGCVLFELLCHRGPFGGGSSLVHHLETTPLDPRTYRQDTPPELAGLILQCLAKQPDRRPSTAATVDRTLAGIDV